MSAVKKRFYDSNEFVARDEIQPIIEAVTDLAKGRSVDMRAFSLADESGMGKTWTLRHLAESVFRDFEWTSFGADRPGEENENDVGKRLSEILGVRSLYVDLLEWSSGPSRDGDPEQAIKYLIGNMSLRVSRWHNTTSTGVVRTEEDLRNASLADLSRWLEADVRRFTRESVFVLLMDQVHEAPWRLLEYLDLFVIGPLAAIPRVLPVVAGRGQGYPWRSPEMQLRCRTLRLMPFDVEQTKEQLRRQAPGKEDEAELIHEQSKGYPRLSYFIARLGEIQGLHAELTTILQVEENEEERRKLQEYLDAICVLRSFDDDRTVDMMAALVGSSVDRSSAAEVRKRLMHHSLAFWPEENATGWTLDGCLRHSKEQLLRLESPEQYKLLHRAARDLYKKWYTDYAKTASIWKPEADYHALQLKDFEASEASTHQ